MNYYRSTAVERVIVYYWVRVVPVRLCDRSPMSNYHNVLMTMSRRNDYIIKIYFYLLLILYNQYSH